MKKLVNKLELIETTIGRLAYTKSKTPKKISIVKSQRNLIALFNIIEFIVCVENVI